MATTPQLPASPDRVDLTVLVLATSRRDPLREVVSRIQRTLQTLPAVAEIVIVSASEDGTDAPSGTRLVRSPEPGYGCALRTGIESAKGEWVFTIDGNLSHDPGFLLPMYRRRQEADLVIGSRYVWFGNSQVGVLRAAASRLLSSVFARILSLPYRDLSSGFRLYRRSLLTGMRIDRCGYSSLLELIVKAHAEGYRLLEIPLHFFASSSWGEDHRPVGLAKDYLAALLPLWKLRNSIFSADYDARGFYSNIPPQRYWQRARYRLLRELLDSDPSILDIGCGSSMVMVAMPQAVGLDIQHKKLRYLKQVGLNLTTGSLTHLPFRTASFGQVICSQVIEHVPREMISFGEMDRVLRPGGTLLLGTPDYGRIWWPITEFIYQRVMPGGYADEHITHFTHDGLIEEILALGYQHEATRYILGGEMILKFRKRA
jgi:dolichol-phosphate mannosyltransferase